MFLKRVFLILLFAGRLHAGWNEDFDAQTKRLSEALPQFQQSDYLKNVQSFVHLRSKLLKDAALVQRFEKTALDEKLIVNRKKRDLILKKRRNHHIHDLYAWELSHLLGSSDFFVPSFPIEIGGKRVIIQKLEDFDFGDIKSGLHSRKEMDRVSLETYWKAHIQAYLLGLGDLSGRNIGITSKGNIRFFDNESSLIYYNVPFKTEMSFSMGFISHSFDWPQYSAPLDQKTVNALTAFIQSFAQVEDSLRIYEGYRPVTASGLLFRLDKIRTFPLNKGSSFKDLYSWIYPRLGPGLDELNNLVGGFLHKKIGHGTTLFFTCRWMHRYRMPAEFESALKNWIQIYVE